MLVSDNQPYVVSELSEGQSLVTFSEMVPLDTQNNRLFNPDRPRPLLLTIKTSFIAIFGLTISSLLTTSVKILDLA